MSVYLKPLKARYFRANRKCKSQILNEFCATSGLHRKHVIRLLTRTPIGWREKPDGRKKQYVLKELITPLRAIWLATDIGKNMLESMRQITSIISPIKFTC